MQKTYIRSSGLPKGIPIELYSNLTEVATDLGAEPKALKAIEEFTKLAPAVVERLTHLLNLYLQQKDCLVEGRASVAEKAEEISKFTWPSHTESRTLKDGSKSEFTVYDWTESEYMDKLRAAIAGGKVQVNGVAATPEGANNWLQSIADGLALRVNAKASERAPREKALKKRALGGAEAIIKNNNQAKWVKIFKSEGIAFEDFQTPDAAVNLERLARAIEAREAAMANQYQ